MIRKTDFNILKNVVEGLRDRIAKLEQQDFRIEIAKLKTEIVSLRGLINRKLQQQEDLKDKDPLENYRF